MADSRRRALPEWFVKMMTLALGLSAALWIGLVIAAAFFFGVLTL